MPNCNDTQLDADDLNLISIFIDQLNSHRDRGLIVREPILLELGKLDAGYIRYEYNEYWFCQES